MTHESFDPMWHYVSSLQFEFFVIDNLQMFSEPSTLVSKDLGRRNAQ